MKIEVNGTEYDVEIFKNKLIINNKEIIIENKKDDEIIIDNKKFHLDFYEEGEEQSLLIINGMAYIVSKKSTNDKVIKEIKAPISGKVIDILVQIESTVEKGQGLIMIETMKIYNEIKSPIKGKIKDIIVHKNSSVKTGDVMLIFQ